MAQDGPNIPRAPQQARLTQQDMTVSLQYSAALVTLRGH